MIQKPYNDLVFAVVLTLLAVGAVVFIGVANHSITEGINENEIAGTVLYEDVDPTSDVAEAVYDLARRGIMKGYKDHTFQPDRQITRGEAVKVLLTYSTFNGSDEDLLFDEFLQKNKGDKVIFDDVGVDDWFAPYVYKAYTIGVVKGKTDKIFAPYDGVSLSEMLKMLFTLEREDIYLDGPQESPFKNIPGDAWFTSYYIRAKELGLIKENDLIPLDPYRPMTRGEVALLIYTYDHLQTERARKVYNGFEVLEGQKVDDTGLESEGGK